MVISFNSLQMISPGHGAKNTCTSTPLIITARKPPTELMWYEAPSSVVTCGPKRKPMRVVAIALASTAILHSIPAQALEHCEQDDEVPTTDVLFFWPDQYVNVLVVFPRK